MAAEDLPRLVYLVLLLAVVGGYFLVENRRRLGRTAQQAAIWGLIFLGAVAAAGLWSDIRRNTLPGIALTRDGLIEIAAADDGHFYLTAEVNGVDVLFVVDTGASDIVLNARDARRAGLDPEALIYSGRAMTANGPVATAPVRIDSLRIGPFTDAAVPAVVNRAEMAGSLLGMRYLGRFEMVLNRDRLTLGR
ncbi:MAG: TIGR02281 family clan AA aspartic protease [Alphaproteobacteria bacterium HGW-Alphaproteobacteria-6]|nr:MAG: TIGR02281 family clan AA aspartic protease [Alphaproteobacteria bacterium HGW-Alphaproteobacteria-6]